MEADAAEPRVLPRWQQKGDVEAGAVRMAAEANPGRMDRLRSSVFRTA